jgi:hypothetical protein
MDGFGSGLLFGFASFEELLWSGGSLARWR